VTTNVVKFHSGYEKRGGEKMPEVSAVGEVWKCDICGNVVEVKEAGGGELVCCGEPMKLVT
jgi:desulfoferrodoxin-like iron-binding protein